MGMADLHRGLRVVAGSEMAFFAGRREDSLVAAAEAALGVTLPPTYRKFVVELGAGDIGGHEFYGVTTSDFQTSSIPNGIWLTLEERKTSDLPSHLLIVADTGTGGYYVLDTSSPDERGECPVIEWKYQDSKDEGVEVVAPDFGLFFWEALQQALEP